MDQTTNFGLPFPEADDPPDGPSQIGALAEEVDEKLSMGIRSSGATYVAAEQSRSSQTFGPLGTPDRVPDITVGPDGLLFVMYRALVKCVVVPNQVLTFASAAIYLNNVAIKTTRPGNSPASFDGIAGGVEDNVIAGNDPKYGTVTTVGSMGSRLNASDPHRDGSVFSRVHSGANDESFVGTGTVHRGASSLQATQDTQPLQLWTPIVIEVDPGTYNVEVRFRTVEATVYAKQRKIWAWSLGMGLPGA